MGGSRTLAIEQGTAETSTWGGTMIDGKDASVRNGVTGTPVSSPSSLVHPHEISERSAEPAARDEFSSHACDAPPDSPYFKFRHSGWSHLRARVYDAMEEVGLKPGTLSRYSHCGDQTRIYRHRTTGEICLMGNFCRCRTCAPCGVAKSRLIAGNLARFIRHKTVRFLTLTIKHSGDEALTYLIDRCWKSFKLLRRRPQFADNVSGFGAFMETKWSDRTKGWHVHLHVLCEGRWWDQKEISRLWHSCTGDSYIVDIQAKGSTESMAFYAAKYVSKPFNAGDVGDRSRLVEAIRCTHRRHLYVIGGRWKGQLKLLAKPAVSAEWEDVGSADVLFRDADGGNAAALEVKAHLTREHFPATLTPDATPPPHPRR